MYFSAAVRTALLALLAASQVAAAPLPTEDGVAPARISQRSVSASAPGLLAARREEAANEEAASEEPEEPAPKLITRARPQDRKPRQKQRRPGRDDMVYAAVCGNGHWSGC